MRAIDRTTRLFMASCREAFPDRRVWLQTSVTPWGRSHYVYIENPHHWRSYKIRISDHAVGMHRALRGDEDLHLHARATPDKWAVWIGETKRKLEKSGA